VFLAIYWWYTPHDQFQVDIFCFDPHHFLIEYLSVTALLKTLEFQESASSKGHFALYNCLVLGHTKYNGVQRIYCNPFSAKPFQGSHRLDMVMIRLQGINMAPLLFLWILSGMLGFCFCSQHLQ
jgi:hypothetical protein